MQQFDIQYLAYIRDQLWAEASFREEAGESIRLSPHLYDIAALQQERRRETDPWEEVIKDFMIASKRTRITIQELWNLVNIPIENQTHTLQSRLSAIMTRDGYRRSPVRPKAGGPSARGWIKDLPTDSSDNEQPNMLPDTEE